MSRKTWTVALMILSLVPMMPVPAAAHYIIVSGSLRYHSLDCESVLKNVQNLVNNPALGLCTVVGTVVEVECTNPQGHLVRGTASHPVNIGSATSPVEQDALEKKKGRGHLLATILEGNDDITLGLTSESAGCNNNWSLTRALLREADVHVEIYPCAVVGGVPDCSVPPVDPVVSQADFSCVLPPTVTLNDVDPLTGLPDGTLMPCTMEFFQHMS